ncbi:olfactory receptor 14J1-like, partial [Zonotrichia leucophrys gambelii]|uniref:olfactory receptor 14J1-like n=1 Tax=Zonotrichia leucophrys gambelii TaxID=257770 RepID=UPI00313FF62D
MFFFLLNLALSDLGSICTTVPKAMHNSLWDTRDISYSGCAAQVFFFIFFISAEFSLLTVMSYDSYVSICKPLHYRILLGSRACAHMAAAAWASAFLNALLQTANTFSLPLCHGNALGQFFCEVPQILKLSCSHSTLRKIWISLFVTCLAFGCFVFIVFSYVQIFMAVLRIPSVQGRHEAFSTCLPHLAVLSLFLSTGIFAYLKPSSISSPSLDLALSVLCSVVPPALNPLIYSLRNQELKAASSQPGSVSSPELSEQLLFDSEAEAECQRISGAPCRFVQLRPRSSLRECALTAFPPPVSLLPPSPYASAPSSNPYGGRESPPLPAPLPAGSAEFRASFANPHQNSRACPPPSDGESALWGVSADRAPPHENARVKNLCSLCRRTYPGLRGG